MCDGETEPGQFPVWLTVVSGHAPAVGGTEGGRASSDHCQKQLSKQDPNELLVITLPAGPNELLVATLPLGQPFQLLSIGFETLKQSHEKEN